MAGGAGNENTLILDLEQLTELGLESPVQISGMYRHSRFQPTPRQVQIWGSYYTIVSRGQEEWRLGGNFIEDPSNQYFLRTLVDKTTQFIEERRDYIPEDSSPFPERFYSDLRVVVRHRMYAVLTHNNAYLAISEKIRNEIAGASLFLYSQLEPKH